jgi:hypothetical protein
MTGKNGSTANDLELFHFAVMALLGEVKLEMESVAISSWRRIIMEKIAPPIPNPPVPGGDFQFN